MDMREDCHLQFWQYLYVLVFAAIQDMHGEVIEEASEIGLTMHCLFEWGFY